MPMPAAKKLTGAALVAEMLHREGVKYLFGLPGGHIYALMEACSARGIEFISVRHEMNAAFMAEGWALTTGKIGVCIGTAGPGFTNLLTGLANAERGGHPVLFWGGKVRVSDNDRNELQDFNQIDMVKHITRYARTVTEAARLPEYVGRALAFCRSGRPGPVYLEVPRDILEGEVAADSIEWPQSYRTGSRPAASQKDIEAACKLLRSAQRPLIVAGGGVWWAQGCAELRALVEKTGIPVFTRNAARGALPDEHPLCLGIAASRSPLFQQAIKEADVLLLIGTRPGFTLNRSCFPPQLKIIRIDIDPVELTNQLEVTVPITGDARMVMEQLTDALPAGSYPEWVNHLTMMRNNLLMMVSALAAGEQEPVHPLRVLAELRRRIDENTIVVVDGGDAAVWGNMVLPATGPGQFLSIAGTSFGPLGVGVPYAIAAKLAHPDKRVVLLTGDGAFGYGLMEYETALRYGIDFTAVILNDCCWGMIRRGEAARSSPDQPFIGLDLSLVRYDQMVAILGGHGEFVTQPQEIGEALDRALTAGKPACVNVITDVNIGPIG